MMCDAFMGAPGISWDREGREIRGERQALALLLNSLGPGTVHSNLSLASSSETVSVIGWSPREAKYVTNLLECDILLLMSSQILPTRC